MFLDIFRSKSKKISDLGNESAKLMSKDLILLEDWERIRDIYGELGVLAQGNKNTKIYAKSYFVFKDMAQYMIDKMVEVKTISDFQIKTYSIYRDGMGIKLPVKYHRKHADYLAGIDKMLSANIDFGIGYDICRKWFMAISESKYNNVPFEKSWNNSSGICPIDLSSVDRVLDDCHHLKYVDDFNSKHGSNKHDKGITAINMIYDGVGFSYHCSVSYNTDVWMKQLMDEAEVIRTHLGIHISMVWDMLETRTCEKSLATQLGSRIVKGSNPNMRMSPAYYACSELKSLIKKTPIWTD